MRSLASTRLPRRWRFVGGFALIGLQIIIALTGNYTFFNLLAVALCIPLFDDQAFSRILPARLRLRIAGVFQWAVRPPWKRWVLGLSAVIIALGSLSNFADQIGGGAISPDLFYSLGHTLSRYGITNTYGLFAVMTTTRPEIIIEGSSDGVTWLAYENLAVTEKFGMRGICVDSQGFQSRCINADGSMNADTASAWITGMNAYVGPGGGRVGVH